MKHRLLLSCVAPFLICFSVFSQQPAKRAMTLDDGLNMIGVAGPEISPDGQWVIFSRSELNWKENKRPSHLWMVKAEGGEPFQFTSGDQDSAPQWSPDGKTIAFIRSKEASGTPGPAGPPERQIWTIRINGGEAIKLTDHKDGLASFRWSKDGKKIFFLAEESRSEGDKKAEKGGDDAIYVDEGANGQARGRWNTLWVWNLDEKKEHQITRDKVIISGMEPSPDGAQVVFHGRKESARNAEYLSEIYLVDVSNGAITRLTNNEAPERGARWSPDGKRIAYLAPDDKKWELAGEKLWIMDVANKQYHRVPAQFEGGIGRFAWAKDGGRVFFDGQNRTNRNLYQVNLETGAVKPVTSLTGVFNADSFSEDGTMAAGTYSSAQTPAEVWITDESGHSKQLTHFNGWFSDIKAAKSEVIKWKSKDGLEVEGLLYLPADYTPGNKVPLILNVHGGPAGSFTNSFNPIYHVYAGLGYASLCPNVRGSSGYNDALLRGNMKDLGGGDYQDLMTGVDMLVQKGIADPDKMGIKGWSYGGILGGWTITQTDRFKAASLGAMVSDWSSEYAMGFNFDTRLWYIGGTPWDNPEGYRNSSSYTRIKNVKTPAIIFHGEQDTTDSIGQSMMYYQGLKDRGVPTRFIRFPREPHGFREPHHQRIRDAEEIAWMQKYVNGVEWKSVRPEEKPDPKDKDSDKDKDKDKDNPARDH